MQEGNKYLQYKDDIIALFNQGEGNFEIARRLIGKYQLPVKADYLRKQVAGIVQWFIADKEIVRYNVHLAKQKQAAQDTNRIERKSFREYARFENALVAYNKELIKVLKTHTLPGANRAKRKIGTKKAEQKCVAVVQLTDTHFNELIDIRGNKYDFTIAGKRLKKFFNTIKKFARNFNVKEIMLAITGDLLNSDRRLDEKLALSTNRAKATFLAVHLVEQFILDLYSLAPVNVVCVTGNESRVNEILGFTDITASDNYDFTIYEILRLLFKKNRSVKFLNCGIEVVVKIGKQNILMIHGHQIKDINTMHTSKLVAKYAKNGVQIDFVICGHLHEAKLTDTYARAGSLCGGNAYSYNGLNLYSRASQNIYLFTPSGRHDIRVDLQDTEGINGYEVDTDLAMYNAKSLLKTRKPQIVHTIVI